MRFAFVSTMYGGSWGGSEELWSQTACKLKQEGHDVLASTAYWLAESKRVTELARIGIQIEPHSPYPAGQARRFRDRLLYGGPRVYDRVGQFNPDLAIISQGHNSGGFDWAKFFRKESIPYTVIVQCNNDHCWFGEQLDDALEFYLNAEKTFCVSKGNLDLLRLQLGDSLLNSEVVWNPFSVTTEPAPRWPDGTGTWRLACPARLHPPSKGQDLLLRILASKEWRELPVELNLFGAGPDELALRRIVKSFHLSNVYFRGHVPDIRAVWEQNHLLVLPSRYEGLPITLVEAMWCGRPAVVTDVGDNGKLCVDGKTGFVAEAPTVSAFSKAMERAWERRLEWPDMGLAARHVADDLVPKDPVAIFSGRLKERASDGARHKQDRIRG